LEEHPSQALGGRGLRAREIPQAREQPVDDAVDRAEEDLLLAREVQVDRPARDARLASEVVDGRLLVPQAPEEAVGRVEDGFAGGRLGQKGFGHGSEVYDCTDRMFECNFYASGFRL